MRVVRRFGSLVALVALVGGVPWVLLRAGFYDWGVLNLWSPADPRLILAALTLVAWLAWAVMIVSLALESVRLVTAGRISWSLPGLGAPRAVASMLLTSLLASAAAQAATASAAPAPVSAPSVPSQQAGPRPVAESRADSGRSLPPGTREASGEPESSAASGQSSEGSHGGAMIHVVSAGDDLWSLGQRYYGAGDQWRRIVAANPDLAEDPARDLVPGTVLVIVDPGNYRLVLRGDTLRKIADEELGDADSWPAGDRSAEPRPHPRPGLHPDRMGAEATGSARSRVPG
ncbi:LysM peptidoglycan-binding domain-containing protein [Nigerium massiliense]|uniref:LysM peptidoglycan-binding domain-containing protein n=1 Tax=Nigerium massiliense TaxID=1522317 RepID=UPI00058D3B87|nr:LysM domain-containing protein [Nigerium massiliense]